MFADRFRVQDRVAIITGAGRGIGAATAIALAEAGADILLCARTEKDLIAAADKIRKVGRKAHIVVADLAKVGSASRLVEEAIAVFGRIDILVNNVGCATPASFQQTTLEDLEAAFRFNVSMAHTLTKDAVPYLIESAKRSTERGGDRSSPSIVSISSAYGHRTARGLISYGTAKAALLHWTRMAAADLAPEIRVNAIAAGIISSSALEPVLANDELRRKFELSSSLQRIGTPEDVASGVLYLVSPAASFVTGTVLEIDGGPSVQSFQQDQQ
jgi:7-alpha-hydroxysteroid dehydrogenase